jgi:asparagine synthase (glutamine-hydrolysing)
MPRFANMSNVGAMCGFVGGTDSSWDVAVAVAALQHRGPDATAFRRTGPLAVGFCRLKVVDLGAAANQPMTSADGAVTIAFNGEIYGFQELRRELEGRGHRFRTRSDTEVLLASFLEWGERFPDHLDGMFAIAIHDARDGTVHLLRDRVGIKPLYYLDDGVNFGFASELKGIEALVGRSTLSYDETALYDFLTYHYVPTPKTAYRNVFKLRPAHHLIYDLAKRRITRDRPFWTLEVSAAPDPVNDERAATELRERIQSSVQEQLVADVPIGFFLSGGIDSSAVLSAAKPWLDRPWTFSMGFEADRDSETEYARSVAAHLGAAHEERILSADTTRDLVSEYRRWFDEPFGDVSAFPTNWLARFVRERGAVVVLTGDGGDELFGGYRRYRKFARYSRWPAMGPRTGALLNRVREAVAGRVSFRRTLDELDAMLKSDLELYASLRKQLPLSQLVSYRRSFEIPSDYDDLWHYRRHWRRDLPLLTRLQYLDFHTFLPDLVLTKVDRTTMSESLEARVPLLARRVVEFVFGLPEATRYRGGQQKGIFKHAFRHDLPAEVLSRRKRGFSPPRRYIDALRSAETRQEYLLRIFLSAGPDSELPGGLPDLPVPAVAGLA